MSERGRRRRIADWWKRTVARMGCAPSCALVSAGSFDERLRNVFSLRKATPVLNEYLLSIQIDDENPGFAFSWDLVNLSAFVAAANALGPARAPVWLRSQRPPQITVDSFTEDLVQELLQVAGGRCGRVLLAPNTPAQFVAVVWTLAHLHGDSFMQDAARAAFGDAEGYIATTYNLTDSKAQLSVQNNLPRPSRSDQLLRRIFI